MRTQYFFELINKAFDLIVRTCWNLCALFGLLILLMLFSDSFSNTVIKFMLNIA